MSSRRIMKNLKENVSDHFRAFEAMMQRADLQALERVVQRLRQARDQGATIYICGNGGSAATASHWVNDLGKATKAAERPPMRVMSLSDNVSWLTALANDEGYDRVFAGQLENFARKDDVLVVISSSGNSSNLVRAVEVARSRGMTIIGLLGFDGGVLRQLTDDCLVVQTAKGLYGLVEPMHEMVCHLLTACVAA